MQLNLTSSEVLWAGIPIEGRYTLTHICDYGYSRNIGCVADKVSIQASSYLARATTGASLAPPFDPLRPIPAMDRGHISSQLRVTTPTRNDYDTSTSAVLQILCN